ncbi:MAG: Methyltransferase type 11 (modular protein) [Firmicutes bacterium]|nr:Methyltransferase type 11 (modular protein) [Bacillota bacterium]
MNIDFEHLKKRFGEKARDYASDSRKAQKLVDEAMKKSSGIGPIAELGGSLKLIFGLVRDYGKGRYRDIQYGSLIAIIIGLLYFVAPIDSIPDIIPMAGFIDDAAVLGLIIKQVKSELDKYRIWLDKNRE